MKIFHFVMDPLFSQDFIKRFAFMGDFGIVLLVLLKMVLMFAGALLLISPIILVVYKLHKRYTKYARKTILNDKVSIRTNNVIDLKLVNHR